MASLWSALTYNGRVRRISAARVAYAIAKGHWPSGLIAKPRHKPSAFGGRASSLVRRAEADMALIRAMSEAPDASIAKLSALTGVGESRVSTRLTKLAERDLTQSPMCVPGRSWCLTAQGRVVAISGQPLLDQRDRDILTIIARSPAKLMALAQVTGSCRLTARRRIDALVERGLVSRTDGRFMVTAAGLAALGPDAPRPWVQPAAVAASLAKDVTARRSLAVMTFAEMGRMGGQAAARLRKASLMDDRIAS